ncbi:uncharacterized protein EI90DRAFT_3022622 [Cantharellus anzutake]|uniref:uncharacterized protein n=1 Tax=Cantharellus anzutake TaxID=1750568 RepID=UPI001908D3D2|nr:uncharacterized protein EI90DRAFT_3022622 [Cantharellus anzutake]KAF8313530.1 hypothetical protein EI90DRAFT_3022622 [Cantharellus anzutake]
MPPASRRKIPSDELRMWARAPKNSVVDPLKTPVTGSGSTVHVLGSILTTGFLLARKGKAPAQGAGLNPGSFRRTRPYWSGVWAEIGDAIGDGGMEAEVVQEGFYTRPTSQDRECVASATHITQFRLNDPGWSERRIALSETRKRGPEGRPAC